MERWIESTEERNKINKGYSEESNMSNRVAEGEEKEK